MSDAKLNGMLLASSDPTRLCQFYEAAFELEAEKTPDDGYQALDLGGFYILLDSRDDVSGANKEPGRVIFNVEVSDAKAAADRIESAGGTWLAPLEDRDGSLFATAIDPDGNYVQIIQLSEQMKQEMAGG